MPDFATASSSTHKDGPRGIYRDDSTASGPSSALVSRACQCSAGTRPKWSSIEGRKSSDRLRTVPTVRSAISRAAESVARHSVRSSGMAVIALPKSTSSAVSDWPISSCSSRDQRER